MKNTRYYKAYYMPSDKEITIVNRDGSWKYEFESKELLLEAIENAEKLNCNLQAGNTGLIKTFKSGFELEIREFVKISQTYVE